MLQEAPLTSNRFFLALERGRRLFVKIGLWDLGLMAFAFFLYYLVRGTVEERVTQAHSTAVRIIELEQNLGLFWETQMQDWVISSRFWIELFNNIYVYAHFPAVVAIGVWLFFWHRRRYVLFRNAFLISGAIGLLIFNLLPTAPPRLLPSFYGFEDTMGAFSAVNYDLQPAAFVNQYAAMPSLHFGWNMLLGIAIWRTSHNPLLRAFAVLMPVAMSLSVIVTANHFILDVFAGAVVGLIGLSIALIIQRHGWKLWAWLIARRRPNSSQTMSAGI